MDLKHVEYKSALYFGLSLFQLFLIWSHESFYRFSDNASGLWSNLGSQVSQNIRPYRKQSKMQSILDSFENKTILKITNKGFET